MALFRKSRRQRSLSDSPSHPRREQRGDATAPPLLQRLDEIAAEATVPEEALEPALRALVDASGAVAGALCLFDARQSVLRLTAETGLSDDGCRRLRTIRRGDPGCWDIPLHGVVNRRAYLIENAAQNRYVPLLVSKKVGMRTIACVPIFSGGVSLGSVILVTAPPRSFAERDVTMLWKPLLRLAKMIEAVRRQAPAGEEHVTGGRTAFPDLLGLTTERDRLRTELVGRTAEFDRLLAQLQASREEIARLTAGLEQAAAERAAIARELERVRTESEDTSTLAQALAEAERERQRLVASLEEAAREADAREARAIAQARQETAAAAEARTAELEAGRRTHATELATAVRIAEERQKEIERLAARVATLEVGSVAERGRDQRRDGEIARLSAALEAAAARETDLRARLAAHEAERLASADTELVATREALAAAEAAQARSEERATGLDAELQATRHAARELEGVLAQAHDDLGRARSAERAALADAERHQAAIAEAQSVGVEARARLEATERILGDVTAERDRAHQEARGLKSAVALAEARLEGIAAERDQLREALARSEAECVRLRAALDTARSVDAQVEATLAAEKKEQVQLAARLAEIEAVVARLEAIEAEQRLELEERRAEIVLLTAEQTRLISERDQLLADRETRLATASVDAPDLETVAADATAEPAAAARPEPSVTVISVGASTGEREFVPSGAPIVIVLDGEPAWNDLAIAGHDVVVVRPGADSVSRVASLDPSCIVANLAAPGALTALTALRAQGSTTRVWACIADAPADRALALGAVEPVVGPIDPDLVIRSLGEYATKNGRVVTAGANVDALMSLRQALSRRRVSVSMAWDAKQANEMLGMVRPHAVVVDMSMPKRDGCAIVASLAALDPIPLTVLVAVAGDPAHDFAATLNDAPHGARIERIATVAKAFVARTDEMLPRVEQQPQAKVHAMPGVRWLG
jgi:CheY-like chemotaxis protein